jgi:hypothetical protein
MAARSDGSGGGQKNAGTLRIVGIVVLALAAVGVGAWRMGFLPFGASHNDDSVLAHAPETAVATPAKPPTAGGAADLDAPALEPLGGTPGSGGTPGTVLGTGAQPTRRPGTRAASSGGSSSAAVTAVAPEAPRGNSQMARLDEHLTYQYTTLNRRDPFQSLLTGEYVPQEDPSNAPPDPGGMKIVGIVWGASDQFAMVEDARGNSYVLRKGDKLQNGFVESLRRDAVVINVTTDGQSQTVVIPFVRKGDANAR